MTRPLSILLRAAGVVCLVVAGAADLLLDGRWGFGWRQLLLAALGIALLVVSSARGRDRLIRAWTTAPQVTAAQSLLAGVWWGMLVGGIEVGHRALIESAHGAIVARPVDHVWMIPVVYLAVFGLLGGLVGGASRWFGGVRLPVLLFSLAFAAVWSQALLHQVIDQTAALVLALGVGVALARAVSARAAGFLTLVRRSMPWLAAALSVVAVALPVSRTVREHRALADLPPARDGAPNVLLVVLDTVRADHLETYGYTRHTTPNIEQFARTGLVFEQAMATSPWTLPSHATLFTGRYPHEMTADWLVPLDDRDRTLAEVFAAHGYTTAGFVGNLNYCPRVRGIARGFAHYEDFLFSPSLMLFCTALTELRLRSGGVNGFEQIINDAETVTDHFLEWLPQQPERPFFAFLNYIDAHAPYTTSAGHEEKFTGGSVRPYRPKWHMRKIYDRRPWSDEDLATIVDAYDECLAYLDGHFGRLITELDRRGILANTIVVVTGDHGEQFGEHGLVDHANSLYRPLLHVPLILSLPPDLHAPRRIVGCVSLRDVPATLLDLAGLTREQWPGQSLRPLWAEDSTEFTGSPVLATVRQGINAPDWFPVHRGDLRAVFQGGLHYIWTGDDHHELYDVAHDPDETHDLALTSQGRTTAAKMQAAIRAIIR